MFSFGAQKELQKKRKDQGTEGEDTEGVEQQFEPKPFDMDKLLQE